MAAINLVERALLMLDRSTRQRMASIQLKHMRLDVSLVKYSRCRYLSLTSMNIPVISIIDDDEPTPLSRRRAHARQGFSPSTYDSAEGFLDARGQETSQCIITDIFMPGLSGIELKQRLNVDACTVPVIMISARLEDRLQSAALDAGAFCVLRKPFKAHALIQCVEKRSSASQGAFQCLFYELALFGILA